MSLLRVASFFLLLLISDSLCSLYGPKSSVIPLTKKNFAEKVFGTEHVWVVEFYAPWCGHCKSLAPEYEKAATNLNGLIKVGAVNCDDEKEICGNFGVQGFPTIKIFPSQATAVPGKKDAFHKVPEDYQGARSAGAIVNHALSKLPSFVVPVTSVNQEKFTSQELPKALLFTDKGKTSDLYKALSVDFHNRMVLGEVKHSDKKLVEQYKVEKYPTLLVLGAGENGVDVAFEGKLSHPTLFSFLGKYALPPPQGKSGPTGSAGSGSKESTRQEPEAEPETGEIHELKDQATFDTKCVNKGGLCVITLLDNENMETEDVNRYVSVLKTLGEKYKGRFRLFYVLDGPAQTNVTKTLDLSASYPNTVVLNPKKLRYIPFRGAFAEESLSEFFESVLAGKKSIPVDHLPSILPAGEPKPKKVVQEEDQAKSEEKEEL